MKLIRKFYLKGKLLKGFTLIELVMTIIVVSIVAVPISLFISQHIEGLFQSKETLLALNLARFEMEKVNNLTYNNITIGTFNFPNYQGYNLDVTRTVTYQAGSGISVESLKKIVVDVKRPSDSKILASFTTYIAKNITYGV